MVDPHTFNLHSRPPKQDTQIAMTKLDNDKEREANKTKTIDNAFS